MRTSEIGNAFIGFLNLNAFFFQAGIIGILVWIETGSFITGVGFTIGLFIMLAFKKLAWVIIGGFTFCWCYIGWTFWGIGGTFILGFIGFGINWSVSQFAQVLSGGFDENGESQEESNELFEEDEFKKCPFCAENIKIEAKLCRYCQSPLPEESIQSECIQSECIQSECMESKTGINIELGYFFGAFFLFFCCPKVEVAGKTYEKPWGTHFIELPVGIHNIKVFFKYFENSRCGENQINVELQEREVKRIKFFMPPLMTASGKLTVLEQESQRNHNAKEGMMTEEVEA